MLTFAPPMQPHLRCWASTRAAGAGGSCSWQPAPPAQSCRARSGLTSVGNSRGRRGAHEAVSVPGIWRCTLRYKQTAFPTPKGLAKSDTTENIPDDAELAPASRRRRQRQRQPPTQGASMPLTDRRQHHAGRPKLHVDWVGFPGSAQQPRRVEPHHICCEWQGCGAAVRGGGQRGSAAASRQAGSDCGGRGGASGARKVLLCRRSERQPGTQHGRQQAGARAVTNRMGNSQA